MILTWISSLQKKHNTIRIDEEGYLKIYPFYLIMQCLSAMIRLQKRGKQMRDANQTIGNLIDHQKFAYISSIDEDGFPNTKAMYAPRVREGIKVLYFTTNTSSKRVAQFLKNANACVYFNDTRFFLGIMLKGTMEVLEDAKSKKMIWKDGDEMYYPKGVSDPDYCVLRFTATVGRYYQNFKS